MFGRKKRKVELITKQNIEDFLKNIDETILKLARQSPAKVKDNLLKESQVWFDNTVNKDCPLDIMSFKAGACYGVYRYMKATVPDKESKQPSYIT